MSRRNPEQHPAAIRPGVWLFAAICLLAALGIAAGLTRSGEDGRRAAVATKSRESSALAIANEPPREAIASRSDAALPARADLPVPVPVALHAVPAEDPRAGSQRAVAMVRADAPGDSQIAAEIRVLESEAARAAESLDLVAGERGAASRDRAAEDARVQRLADALLVEHFVQDAYHGTLFPVGFPAEERTRAAAESQVRGLTPEMRRDLLDVVLQGDGLGERVAPEFAPPESGFVWESVSR